MKYNVLLVENLTIYYNAIEAMAELDLYSKDTVLIVTSIIRTNLVQLKSKIADSAWASVHYPTLDGEVDSSVLQSKSRTVAPPSFVDKMLFLRKNIQNIKNVAASLENVDTIICGVYGNEMALSFCACTDYSRYVLVDDGNMTMFTAKGRPREGKIRYKRVLGVNSISRYVGVVGWIKLFVKRFFLKVRDLGISEIIFFTSHHDIPVNSPDNIIQNRYTGAKSDAKQVLILADHVYFLGAPILERNILKEEDFVALLDKVSRQYQNKKIVYFPHRMETSSSLSNIKKAFPGAEVRCPEVPFEIYIGGANERPKVISSFYSSALTNLAAMELDDVNIHVIRFPWKKVLDPRKAVLVKDIYNSLATQENAEFQVIDVTL